MQVFCTFDNFENSDKFFLTILTTVDHFEIL